MLSLLGWIDGMTAMGAVISGILLGIFFIQEAKKKNAKLLFPFGIVVIFAGLLYLGVFLDFVHVLLTNNNFPNSNGEVALLSYIWFAPMICIAVYMAGELQYPENKWYIVSVFIILGIIFNLLIFINPIGSFSFGSYAPEGEGLIDYNINLFSPAGIFLIIMLIPLLIFLGMGLLVRVIRSSGLIRKRFSVLLCGVFTYGVFGILEGYTLLGYAIVLVRIGYIGSFYLSYLGLKTLGTEKLEENQELDKSVASLIEKLGFDYTKPDDLTEEDVNFYREQTACLVCKNLLVGFTLNYICPDCRALYCVKCARAISTLENLCWSCNKPIDYSKPVKMTVNKEESTIIKETSPRKKP